MVDIANISHGASLGLLYNIYHIARSIIRLIREDHRFAAHNEEASTSYEPSIRPSTSSTRVRMQPILGQGKGRGGRQGHDQPGQAGVQGGGPSGCCAVGRSIDETSIPPEYSIPPF